MIKKILRVMLKSFLIFLSVLILIVFGFAFFLTGTTSGLQFAINKTNEYLGEYVSIEGLVKEGSVLQGFSFENKLKVIVPGIITVSSDNFSIKYDFSTLVFRQKLLVKNLKADYLQVRLHDFSSENNEDLDPVSQDETPFHLNFPIPIYIEKFSLKNFSYMSDIVDVVIDKSDMALEAYDDKAKIIKGDVNKLLVYLKSSDEHEGTYNGQRAVLSSQEISKILDEKSSYRALEDEKLLGIKEFFKTKFSDPQKFPQVILPLYAEIENLNINDGRYYMQAYDSGHIKLSLSAIFNEDLLYVNYIRASHALGNVNLNGKMLFKDWYNMDFKLSGSGNDENSYGGLLRDLKGAARVKGDISEIDVFLDLYKQNEKNQRAKLLGVIRPLDENLPFAVNLDAKDFFYKLSDEQLYNVLGDDLSESQYVPIEQVKNDKNISKSENSSFKLQDPKLVAYENNSFLINYLKLKASGEILGNSTLDLDVLVNGLGLKDFSLKTQGALNFDRAKVSLLSLDGFYQNSPLHIDYEGQMEYGDDITVSGRVHALSDDAKSFSDILAGKFDINSQFILSLIEDDVLFSVETLSSDFKLQGLPAKIYGKQIIGSIKDGISVDELSFKQSENSISLKGALNEENSNLNGTFNLNSLNTLDPNIEGVAVGKIKVEGDYKNPSISLIANSRFLKYQDIFARSIILNANLSLPEINFNTTLLTEYLRFAKDVKPYRQCSLDISGALSSHRLTFSCGGVGNSYISAKSGYDLETKSIKGELSNFILSTPYTELISIKNPVSFDFNFGEQKGSVGKIELSDGTTILKVAKTDIEGNSLKTNFNVTGFNLSYLNAINPRNFKLKGNIDLLGDIKINNGKPNIGVLLKANRGLINIPNYFIPYKNIDLKLNFTQSVAQVDIDASLSRDNGSVNGRILIKDPLGKRALGGNISLKELNLDLFTAAGGIFNQLSGRASLNGRFDGNLKKPLFFGNINLHGNAQPHYNIGNIDKFNVNVNSFGDHGSLDGDFKVNGGSIALGGNLNWSEGANGNLSIYTHKLPLLLLGYGEAYVNLDAKARLDDEISVRGNLEIPKARIVVSSIESGAKAPSKDEIFIEYGGVDNLIKEKKHLSAPLKSQMDFIVSMGDDVQLEAMGLKSHVIGSVRITKKLNENDIQGQGKISLDNGKAELYGHRFVVNYADTIFNGKISDPKLNVEVIADPFGIEDDVIAGVHVKGSALDPQIELFSNPAMSQNEILSYILYGHGLEKNTEDSEGQSSQLLMTLGLGTTTGLVNSIAGALGMQGVQFASSGSGDETTVGVQTYITKNIRLSYGYGVFTSLSEFRIRYELMRKLYAEFISSLDQSIDLVYSFDFD